MTDELSSQLNHLHRRPPVLDDTVQVWTDEPVIDYQRAYESMCDKSHTDNATIDALRSDLSAARYQRDIWFPLAFCVGVICGIGLGVWLS